MSASQDARRCTPSTVGHRSILLWPRRINALRPPLPPRRTCTTATAMRTATGARNVRSSRPKTSCVACGTASRACGRGTRSARWKAAGAPGSPLSGWRGASPSSARCTNSPAWCRCVAARSAVFVLSVRAVRCLVCFAFDSHRYGFWWLAARSLICGTTKQTSSREPFFDWIGTKTIKRTLVRPGRAETCYIYRVRRPPAVPRSCLLGILLKGLQTCRGRREAKPR